MATLETQYKNFLSNNPESKFTFDEWKKWLGNSLKKSIENDFCSIHWVNKVDGMGPKCMEENHK